jgi:hypothetical protein
VWYKENKDLAANKITIDDIQNFAEKISAGTFSRKYYLIGGAALKLLGSPRETAVRHPEFIFGYFLGLTDIIGY